MLAHRQAYRLTPFDNVIFALIFNRYTFIVELWQYTWIADISIRPTFYFRSEEIWTPQIIPSIFLQIRIYGWAAF
jgi:hypothetical protein